MWRWTQVHWVPCVRGQRSHAQTSPVHTQQLLLPEHAWERKIFDGMYIKGNVLCTVFSNPFLFYLCKCNHQNLSHLGMTSINWPSGYFNNSGTFPIQQNLSSLFSGAFAFVELVSLLSFHFFSHRSMPPPSLLLWPTSLCLHWKNKM